MGIVARRRMKKVKMAKGIVVVGRQDLSRGELIVEL
jgi:hypothetical protein